MSERYFSNFPRIYYDGKIVRNIVLKARFFQDVIKNYTAFLPYTVKDGERADIVAQYYYGDWRYDWLVFISNDILDPYFEWPLDQNQFHLYIDSKYGSHEESVTSIRHYVYNTDVESDDTGKMYKQNYEMTPETFSFLPADEKGYWKPVYWYEWEFEQNELKRNIKLLDNRLLKQIDKEISEIFKK